jgi:hypothetical protein
LIPSKILRISLEKNCVFACSVLLPHSSNIFLGQVWASGNVECLDPNRFKRTLHHVIFRVIASVDWSAQMFFHFVLAIRFASMCDWLAFGALYARNGRSLNGQRILTEEWISMTTRPNHAAHHGEISNCIHFMKAVQWPPFFQGNTACTGL